MSNSDFASKQLNKIDIRIREAISLYGREENSVTLIGASKQQRPDNIRAFANAGLTNVGENYLNEARDKQNQLIDLSLNWHFIGKVQSNKSKLIANNFCMVHGVEKFKHAKRLSDAVLSNKRLKILIQVNIDREPSKGGALAEDVLDLCAQISDLENTQLCGFMLIPKARPDTDSQRVPFAQARSLLEQCNQTLDLKMTTLSMGMSNDLEAAIAEGSTMVRVGTALFGARV